MQFLKKVRKCNWNKCKLTLFTLSLALSPFMVHFGKNITFTDQWPLFESLRTTSSIVFAVTGIWLALIFPERLKFINKKEEYEAQGIVNINWLMSPIAYSLIILIIILIVGIIAPILKQIQIIMLWKEALRGASFLLLYILSCWQILAIYITLAPAAAILGYSNAEAKEQELRDNYRPIRKPPPKN